MCDGVCGGGACSEDVIKEEGPEEVVGVWGSRNWMMDYGMFSSFYQAARNSDGCHSLRCYRFYECVRAHAVCTLNCVITVLALRYF